MKKSKFTEEQIAYALRQVEAGTPPADVCGSWASAKRPSTSGRRSTRISASASCVGCDRSRTRMAGSNDWSRTSRSTNTSCPRPCEKKSEAHTAPRAGGLGPSDLRRQLRAGLSSGAVQSGGVVSPQSGEGSNRAAGTDPRARARPASIRVPAHLGAPASGRLAGE